MEYTIEKAVTMVNVKLTEDEVREIYDRLTYGTDLDLKFQKLVDELDD